MRFVYTVTWDVFLFRLGEIKLKDFKNLFEDCERYRYYFKALDPEYGTVKEEVRVGELLHLAKRFCFKFSSVQFLFRLTQFCCPFRGHIKALKTQHEMVNFVYIYIYKQ